MNRLNQKIYLRIALFAIVMIFSFTIILMGTFALFGGKSDEKTIGIICLLLGLPLAVYTISQIIAQNKRFKKLILDELKNNPDKILFQFTDTKSGETVIIAKDVLFINESKYFLFNEFYIQLDAVSIQIDSVIFSFTKKSEALTTNIKVIVNPPAHLLPLLKKWIEERHNQVTQIS